MKKWIDFRELFDSVQKYANKNCDGNFNMAVRQLVKKGLSNAKP